MFELSISVSIPDFDKHPVEVDCPYCKLHTWVTMGEIRRRDISICRGCHRNIILEDYLGSFQRSIRNIQNQLRNFGK